MRRITRASAWSVYDDAGELIGDVFRAGRQFDAVMASGGLLRTYASLGAAARAIRRRAAATRARPLSYAQSQEAGQ